MMDSVEIERLAEHYRSAQTFKLVKLSENPAGLPAEVVPILQKELLGRGEQEAALKLTNYLVELNEREVPLSPEQARAEIMERLKAGESMESIALKFKENGVDVFDELNREVNVQEHTFDYIISLKQKGLKEEELDQKLITELSIDQKEVDVLKEKLRKNGNANMTIGIVITLVMLIVIIFTGRISISGVLLLGIGVWRIIEGQRMLSKS